MSSTRSVPLDGAQDLANVLDMEGNIPLPDPCTPETIWAFIEELALRHLNRPGRGSDHEYAHIEEDRLHQYVLDQIADGKVEDPAACARKALETKTLDFARWCA